MDPCMTLDRTPSRRIFHWLALTAAASAAACSGNGGGGGRDGAPPVVSITVPAEGTVYTNGSVTFEVAVEGEAYSVELLVSGVELAEIEQPPYTFTWDTTEVDEGNYDVRALADGPGGSAESEPIAVVVDRTRPLLVARSPAPGDDNVWLRRPFLASFSEDIDPSSVVAGGTITVTADGFEAVPVAVGTTGAIVSIALTASPPTPATLEVAVDGVTDRAGNEALVAGSWSFTAPVWQLVGGEALDVNPAAPDGSMSAVTVLPGGVPVVAWYEGTSDVYVARETSSGGWTVLGGGSLALEGGPLAGGPALAAHSDGALYVAWTESVSGVGTEPFLRRWLGTAWGALGVDGSIATSDTGDEAYAADLVIDGDGAPLIACQQNDDGMDVWVRRWNGSGWDLLGDDPLGIDAAGDEEHPSIDLDGNVPYVAFSESGAGTQVATWDGSDWQLLGAGIPGTTPSLALGNAGPVVATSSSGNIVVSHWTGTVWERVGGILDAVPGNAATDPALALDALSYPIVTWTELDSLHTTVHVSRWTGTTWESIGPLAPSPPPVNAEKPRIAVDAIGSPVITWHEGPATHVKRRNRF